MNPFSRRTFLRGAGGAMLSLPGFESLATFAGAAGASKPAQRLAIFYVPIGVVRKAFFPGEADAAIPKFTSDQKEIPTKASYAPGIHPLEFTPTLEPLKPIQNEVTFITGMDRTYQNGTDVHAQCGSCFLSSAAPNTITTSAYPLDRTFDHIVADQIGGATPFRTLEISCNSHKDNLESIYFDNISWYGTGHVAPSIRDPRKLYRRLFGTTEIQSYRNITDLVLEDARSLKRELGRSDQEKFGEYFDSIRTIEQQMDKLEGMKDELSKAKIAEPPEALLPRGEYIRLMCDLMVAALQTGLTRVSTLMVGPERWNTPFTYEGLFDKPRSHHQMSHNQDKFIDDLIQLDRFHMEQFVYLVQKMAAVKEADGSSLLDNTILTYGSGLGDGATHQYSDLPIIVAGRGGGTIAPGGRRLHRPEGDPLANLWLTQARALGIKTERFADSTGEISALLT
ncbi:MAG: DUF1552 domain-containing protein [Verrucomicrobiae bacterium]|nr:DUF1552 domain-containing protein [Verrucomicrobiae bacterium]